MRISDCSSDVCSSDLPVSVSLTFMTVDIRFSRTAAKALLRCGKRALVREKIDQLSTEPLALSANVKKLQRAEEHTSELPSLMRNSYAVICLTKKIRSSEYPNIQKIRQHTLNKI